MAIIKCPECGHQVSDLAKVCPSCGVEIAGKVTKCRYCGEIVFTEQSVCPHCHQQLHEDDGHIHLAEAKQHAVHANEPTNATIGMQAGTSQNTEEQPKRKKSKTGTIIVVTLLAIAVVGGVVYFSNAQDKENEAQAYENAMLSPDTTVLQNYLDMYEEKAPQEHIDSIMAHLSMLRRGDSDWTNTLLSGSKSALEQYIRLHPGSVHNTEAKLKIDSIDWNTASTTNTAEAYQAYLDAHQDGLHYDEAKQAFEKADAQKVNGADKQLISHLFNIYFNSLATQDEGGLTSTLSSILNSFLHKENATKSDVITYMNRIHQDADITNMHFTLNNDWKIDKQDEGNGEYSYNVSFSVDQKIERTDPDKEKFCTYKVSAKVSPDGKISDFNMKKIVQ